MQQKKQLELEPEAEDELGTLSSRASRMSRFTPNMSLIGEEDENSKNLQDGMTRKKSLLDDYLDKNREAAEALARKKLSSAEKRGMKIGGWTPSPRINFPKNSSDSWTYDGPDEDHLDQSELNPEDGNKNETSESFQPNEYDPSTFVPFESATITLNTDLNKMKVQADNIRRNSSLLLTTQLASDVGKYIDQELNKSASLQGESIDQSISKFCIIKTHRVKAYWQAFETYATQHDIRQFKLIDTWRNDLIGNNMEIIDFKPYTEKNVPSILDLFRNVRDSGQQLEILTNQVKAHDTEMRVFKVEVESISKELKAGKRKYAEIKAKQDKKREIRVTNLIKSARNQRRKPNHRKIKEIEETLTITEQYWIKKLEELEVSIEEFKAKYLIARFWVDKRDFNLWTTCTFGRSEPSG